MLCYAVRSVGDHLLLENSELCDVAALCSMHTLPASEQHSDGSQPVYLTPQLSSQLHSTHMQPSVVSVLRSVSTTRVHGPSSRAELTARELGCIF